MCGGSARWRNRNHDEPYWDSPPTHQFDVQQKGSIVDVQTLKCFDLKGWCLEKDCGRRSNHVQPPKSTVNWTYKVQVVACCRLKSRDFSSNRSGIGLIGEDQAPQKPLEDGQVDEVSSLLWWQDVCGSILVPPCGNSTVSWRSRMNFLGRTVVDIGNMIIWCNMFQMEQSLINHGYNHWHPGTVQVAFEGDVPLSGDWFII